VIKDTTIKKLCLVALYTSPIISALVVTPLFIVSRYKFGAYPVALLWIFALVLVMWAINIVLVFLLKNKKGQSSTTRYILSCLLCVVLSVLIVQHMFGSLHSNMGKQGMALHFHLVVFFSINTAILILADLVMVKEKNVVVESENMQLRIKNMEAANQQLKHQIQPHFLFNSLSTLKALIKNSPAGAEEYLVKLSDFLRYSISSGHVNTVKVADEVKLCTDYLEMQKIRFGEALQFNINVPAEVQRTKYLPIFSLQILAENAVKHNTLTTAAPLFIDIVYKSEVITVANNLQPNAAVENEAGTGLANLDERYKLLNGTNIAVKKDDKTFAVSINVLE